MVTSSLDDDSTLNQPANAQQTAADAGKRCSIPNSTGCCALRPERWRSGTAPLFWLYYRQGFTAEEIAALPAAGLSAKGVESALRRIAGWLRDRIEGPGPEGEPEVG